MPASPRPIPQKLYSPVIIDPEYHYEALNVDAQQNNPHSLLWWMKHIIGLRRQYRAFGRGTLRFLFPDNPRVLAFIREYEEERILIVANLSRYAQAVQLDLGDMQGVDAGRDVRTDAVSDRRARAVHRHAESVRLLLVPAPGLDCGLAARDPGVPDAGGGLLRQAGGAGAR